MKGRLFYIVSLVLVVIVLALVLVLTVVRPRFTEEDLRTAVTTTLQEEVPQSFLITGRLTLSATLTATSSRYLLRDLLGLNVGTSTATVRIPGYVAYGFDVQNLRPDDIRFAEDGVVEVTIPELSIYSIEPVLEEMEVETARGFFRSQESTQRQMERALEHVRPALRQQGDNYLYSNSQPRINTAVALRAMLRPALVAAGLQDPQFRFHIGGTIVVEPEG